ncbi:peptidoglycan-associated lipoprotein Pal, partial [Escherichia coli]
FERSQNGYRTCPDRSKRCCSAAAVAHANFLRSNPSYKVTVEGHADERGTPEYNISLGERRANAVKMYLQGKGVSADQISIVSYGKEKPAVLGHDEAAYSKNRRAVLVY